MSAHAHRGRNRKVIGLAVASAVGGLVAVSTAGAQQPQRDVTVTKVAAVASATPGQVVEYDIKVKNTGDKKIPLVQINVIDLWADAPPVFVDTDGEKKNGVLDINETALYRAVKTFPTDLALCGTTAQNTAIVVVSPPGQFEEPEDKKKSSKARKRSNGTNDPWVTKTASSGVLVQGGTCPVPPPVVPTTVTPAAVTALRPAALLVEKTGPARMLAGGFATFQIKVTNTGQTDAPNVMLGDLPPRALLWRAVPTGATVSGRTAEWNLGTLAAGQSVTKTVSFRARLSASGTVCNTATATSTTAAAAVDRACVRVTAARRPASPVTG